ncbi:MAG TPA: efflux RND transporter periplasmic adaptor subunit [Gemmatimonadales bacterium]|nr:efflux RND transporter periplasmic adaptor subunit [Gemmatimonadales bacterium]
MIQRSVNARLLLLVLGVIAAGTGCKDKNASAETAADSTAAPASALSLPVVGETVRQGDLVLTVPTTAQVRSEAVATLRSETVGTVAEVLVVPGQRVTRGQALVKLDPRPFDLAVEEAQAAVEQAEVQYNDNIVPDSIVSGKPPTEERRRNALARSGLSGARVRLERAKLDRDRAVITAPFAGVVDRVDVAAGERLSAGDQVAVVVDISDLQIEASVLEHDLPLIRVGGQAVITAAAAPGREIIGRVAAVLPMIDSATRAGRVLVRFRSDGVLRPGMYADVRLESTRLSNRIVVPAPAVLERDGRPLVFVVKEGRAQWVYINPGRSNGLETEVLPDSSTGQIPVAPGDTVLVEGHLTLTHDAPVRVVAKAETD